MLENFLHSDRLATLPEFNYLLNTLFKETFKIAETELQAHCKNFSLNFAYAFENTLHYLIAIDVLEKNSQNQISKRLTNTSTSTSNPKHLSHHLLNKTITYLAKENLLNNLPIESVSKNENGSNDLRLNTEHQYYLFIKSLLLNLNLATPHKTQNTMLILPNLNKMLLLNKINKEKNKAANKTKRNKSNPKKKFFVSYASPDLDYKNELKKHFKVLIDKNLMEYWDGKAILPGEAWDEKIKEHLEKADVILLLISVDFLNSEYINNVELKRAMERYQNGEVTIIPILVRTCDFESHYLNNLHALPEGKKPIDTWPNKDEAYVNIINHIKTIL